MNKKLTRKILLFMFSFFFISTLLYSQDFYWENPVQISDALSCFPRAASNSKQSYIFWQEVDEKNNSIYLSCQYYSNSEWKTNRRFAGPFYYSGDIPDIYSASLSENGTIALAILVSDEEITIYKST
ncbi:MAG: hypothetical protein IJR49_00530, partial [Treponema sp.]|nr:hypothetical protein [Treponema sp.]